MPGKPEDRCGKGDRASGSIQSPVMEPEEQGQKNLERDRNSVSISKNERNKVRINEIIPWHVRLQEYEAARKRIFNEDSSKDLESKVQEFIHDSVASKDNEVNELVAMNNSRIVNKKEGYELVMPNELKKTYNPHRIKSLVKARNRFRVRKNLRHQISEAMLY